MMTPDTGISSEVATPSTNGNGKKPHFDILKEAKEQGIATTLRAIAQKLRVSPTTITNITQGHTNGSPDTRRKIERLFGKPLEQLGNGVPPKRSQSAAAPRPKIAQPAKSLQGEWSLETYRMLFKLNPELKRQAQETLKKMQDEIA